MSDDGLQEIPLFPLENVVLLPGTRAPFHVFEPRYRQMMEAALAGDRTLGMIAVRPQHRAEMAGNPPLFDVGCAGFVMNHERLADGRYHLILEGTERFRVRALREPEGERLYRLARVETLGEAPVPRGDTAMAERRAAVLDLIEPLLARAGREARVAVTRLESMDDAGFVNALVLSLALACEDKQVLLEADGPAERLERLVAVLEFHRARLHAPAGDDAGRLH